MVRVLTGAQVAEERAHEQYVEHLHLKPSSYKFIIDPIRQRVNYGKVVHGVLFGFRILCGMVNVLSTPTRVYVAVDVQFLVWVIVGNI